MASTDLTLRFFRPDEEPETIAHLREVMAKAFADDPPAVWWTRAGRAGHFLEGAALVYVRCLPHARGGGKGSFIAAGVPGEPPRAFALAFDSPREAVTEWQWIRCGAPRALRFCKPRLLWTLFTKLGQDLESIHKAFEKEHGPTLYVFELAVHPDKQGRGWGTIVLKELMGQADAMGRWMYLEASSEGSRRLYLRHGFQDYKEYRIRPDAPPYFCMGRPPTASMQGKAAAVAVTATGQRSSAVTSSAAAEAEAAS